MDVFFARQPIFDRSRGLAGYELLYRARPDSTSAAGVSTEFMAMQVLVDAVLATGIDFATAGKPAYINVPTGLLLAGPFDMLDPRRIVIEILETVQPEPRVEAAIKQLIRAGYRVALDDYALDDPRAPLAPLAHILKLDVLNLDPAGIDTIVAAQQPYAATLLAERVEDEACWHHCMHAGFQLFQGYFFQRPELVRHADLAPTVLQIIDLMNMLLDPESADLDIEDRFRSNVALSYKLLRMANSAAVGLRYVDSIGQVIRALGRNSVHRWLSLLLAAAVPRDTGTSQELMKSALARARFCELILERRDSRRAGQAFLVGLFSQMDALLGVRLDELLERVALGDENRDAITQHKGPLGAALELVVAYEQADWERVESMRGSIGVDAGVMGDLYTASISWADERLALLA
jgi:EAL and modified HD-GYP domain-containing signal transduction protein